MMECVVLRRRHNVSDIYEHERRAWEENGKRRVSVGALGKRMGSAELVLGRFAMLR